jgi:hypothetical protein
MPLFYSFDIQLGLRSDHSSSLFPWDSKYLLLSTLHTIDLHWVYRPFSYGLICTINQFNLDVNTCTKPVRFLLAVVAGFLASIIVMLMNTEFVSQVCEHSITKNRIVERKNWIGVELSLN